MFDMAKADAASGERKTIQISAQAHKQLDDVSSRRGIDRSMYATASRLIEWFCSRPPAVQTVILADVDEGLEPQYSDELMRLARELRDRDRQRRGEPGPPRTFPEQLLHDIAAENGVAPAVAHSIVVSYFMGMAGPRNPPNHEPHIVIEGPMPPANPKPATAAAAPQRRRR